MNTLKEIAKYDSETGKAEYDKYSLALVIF